MTAARDVRISERSGRLLLADAEHALTSLTVAVVRVSPPNA